MGSRLATNHEIVIICPAPEVGESPAVSGLKLLGHPRPPETAHLPPNLDAIVLTSYHECAATPSPRRTRYTSAVCYFASRRALAGRTGIVEPILVPLCSGKNRNTGR